MPPHHDAPLSFWTRQTQINPFFHKLLMVMVFNHSNREVMSVTCSDRPHHCRIGCFEAAQLGWLGSHLEAGRVRCFSLLVQDKMPWMNLVTTLRKPIYIGLELQHLEGWGQERCSSLRRLGQYLNKLISHPKKTDLILKRFQWRLRSTRSTVFRFMQTTAKQHHNQGTARARTSNLSVIWLPSILQYVALLLP